MTFLRLSCTTRKLPVATAAKSFIPALAVILLAGPVAAQSADWSAEWPNTDFSRSSVDLAEIISGGPPRDGIPALSDPTFTEIGAEDGLSDREPVMTLEIDGQVPRAYPIRYLLWHEIVNDQVGEIPVAVTYCPLCNSGLVFDRRAGSMTLTFGVTGKLRNSDMIMYDRETESWWQQAVGEGIVGHHLGVGLTALPAWTESWLEFSERNPDGLVMAMPGHSRPYGTNPYRGYDTSERPFLYFGENPPFGIHPLARVVRVGDRAWLLERLRKEGSLNEHGFEISWREGQASALDSADISKGREVGSIRVREAASGQDVAHDIMFAFAFHSFYPEGEWILAN